MDFQIKIHSLLRKNEHIEKGETTTGKREQKECIHMNNHDPLEERKKNSPTEQDAPQIEESLNPDFATISHQEELINEYSEWL